MQRHFAKEGYTKAFRLLPGPAVAENIGPRAATRAQEIAHVLDHTEHRHIHALKHRNPTPRIDQSKILRCRNNHGAFQRDLLRHRELRIARPGGMSTTMISSLPHSTSRSICVIADITIGPRQIIGVSSSIRKPIDITVRP